MMLYCDLSMSARTKMRLLAVIVLLAALAPAVFTPAAPARAAGVIFVTPGGVGSRDGSSWSNASDLAPALALAVSGDELWVAAGTYTPTPKVAIGQISDRKATFALKSGVAVYGGFAGTESQRAQRNWAAHVVILSGDIDSLSNNAGNSYHVVTGADGATLDGVTISGGNADSGSDLMGGGMYNSASSPTLANVIFSGNNALQGAGMANVSGSSPTLTSVTFSGNTAVAEGGGMANISNSNPSLVDVVFHANSAVTVPGQGFGGGMYNDSSSPTLNGVTFSGNHVSAQGGGMYNRGASSPALNGVTFSGNSAETEGGAMMNIFVGANPTLTDVIFSGNSSGTRGGAIYNHDGSPTLNGVTISGNSAVVSGGAIYNSYQSKALLINVVLSGNSAGASGGAIYNSDLINPSYPVLVHVTISGNSAAASGGAIYNSASTPRIESSIIWGNMAATSDPAIANAGASPVVKHSLVEGSGGSAGWVGALGTDGGGNLDADPLFMAPVPAAPSDGGNLRLRAGSPALDRGGESLIPAGTTADRDGLPRIVDLLGAANGPDGAVDMGAYERQLPDTRITGAPANPTNSTSATFDFTGVDGAGGGAASLQGFECQADGGGFVACTSPHSVDGLIEGGHTFQVRAIDSAGNKDATPASYTWAVDTTPPGISIGAPSTALVGAGPLSFPISYSGATEVTLSPADVTLSTTGDVGGSISVSGSGASARTVTISAIHGNGTLRIGIGGGSARDMAGNLAPASGLSASVTVDTTPPTAAMASSATDPTNATSIPVTLLFSEPVTGLTLADIVPTNATVSGLSGGGASYSFTLAPLSSGPIRAAVAAGAAYDAAGNPNLAATEFSLIYDDNPLAMSLTAPAGAFTRAAPIVVVAAFGMPVSDFTQADLIVTNATVSSFSGSGVRYTIGLTPYGEGSVGASVAANAAHDASGNPSGAHALTLTYDYHPPLVRALLAASPVRGSTAYEFAVLFSDTYGMDLASLGDNDVTVIAPDGSPTATTLVRATEQAGGIVQAVFRIPAPGGVWDVADDGRYTVMLATDAVYDKAGNSAAATSVGTFNVDLRLMVFLPTVRR